QGVCPWIHVKRCRVGATEFRQIAQHFVTERIVEKGLDVGGAPAREEVLCDLDRIHFFFTCSGSLLTLRPLSWDTNSRAVFCEIPSLAAVERLCATASIRRCCAFDSLGMA